MIGPDTRMVDLKDRGELPDPDDSRYYLEIDTDEKLAIICFVEPLRFHAEYNGPRTHPAHAGHPEWTTRDEWSPLVTDDGWLKTEVENLLAARLQGLITSQGHVSVTVEVADYLAGDDEPALGLEIVTEYQDGETFDHWLDRIGWPAVATVINVTDPGTFNSAYLFDMKEIEA